MKQATEKEILSALDWTQYIIDRWCDFGSNKKSQELHLKQYFTFPENYYYHDRYDIAVRLPEHRFYGSSLWGVTDEPTVQLEIWNGEEVRSQFVPVWFFVLPKEEAEQKILDRVNSFHFEKYSTRELRIQNLTSMKEKVGAVLAKITKDLEDILSEDTETKS